MYEVRLAGRGTSRETLSCGTASHVMERIHLTLSDEEINASIPLKPEQPVNSRITVPSEATKPEVGMIWYKKINHCS